MMQFKQAWKTWYLRTNQISSQLKLRFAKVEGALRLLESESQRWLTEYAGLSGLWLSDRMTLP